MDLFLDILRARMALLPLVRHTPLQHSTALSDRCGAEVWLKAENLQHTGSFKARGAAYKLLCLTPELRSLGVVTASSGNHGQGLAWAAQRLGVSVTVYVPASVAAVKLDAMRRLGAQVVLVKGDALQAEMAAAKAAREQGLTCISPYNDRDVIAGQGTLGIEMALDQPDLDAVFIAVGGGGLLSGVATALRGLSPRTRIVACWPRHAASMYHCLQAGRIIEVPESPTLSDGTAGGVEPGAITFGFCQQLIDECVLVDEADIESAMRELVHAERWVVEGAAGVALAALLQYAQSHPGQRLAAVLCGGNIEYAKFLEVTR